MAKKKSFFKTYGFIVFMLAGIVGGCIVGALNPVVKDASGEIIDKGATVLEPIGTVFINLMFCVVVPLVFCSLAGSIACMKSPRRAGKIMGVTIVTFGPKLQSSPMVTRASSWTVKLKFIKHRAPTVVWHP